jgi:four helix bundle protein
MRAEGGGMKAEEWAIGTGEASGVAPAGCTTEGKQDLRRRTKAYASAVVRLFCELPVRRTEVSVLGRQMLKSGTSVAANYREACRARSTAEFVSKIETCAQEADETSLWLELLRDDCAIITEPLKALLAETEELISIFVAVAKNTKRRMKAESQA